MNLTSLRYFTQIADIGNISKAADALFISQPALSRSILRLEESLDVKLFDRTRTGLKLTEAGKILYDEADNIFLQDRLLMEKLHSSNSTTNIPLKVLFSSDTFYDKINRFNLDYNRNTASQKFIIERHNWNSIRHMILKGLADITLCIDLTFRPSDKIRYIVLKNERNYVILPKTHPLSQADEISLEQLKNENFITISAANDFDITDLYTRCSKYNFEPHVTFGVSSLNTVCSEVAVGNGIAVLMGIMVPKIFENDLVKVKCIDLPANNFIIAWNSRVESEALKKVINSMQNYKWFDD